MTACSLSWSLLLFLLSGCVSFPRFVVPDSRDLTIKIRRTGDSFLSTVDTLYLKGARQRGEHQVEGGTDPRSANMDSISITQCDKKTRFTLNPAAKTFVQVPIVDWSERKPSQSVRPPDATSADVDIIRDSVDTGERRPMRSYVARHVKTSIQLKPGPGASTPARMDEIDGWYVDLPGLGCEDRGAATAILLSSARDRATAPDRIHFKQLGNAALGFAIEQTVHSTQGERTTVIRLELLEFSENGLPEALFEMPQGYSPALHNAGGGYDMSKPDTLSNRAHQRWAMMMRTLHGWFQ